VLLSRVLSIYKHLSAVALTVGLPGNYTRPGSHDLTWHQNDLKVD